MTAWSVDLFAGGGGASLGLHRALGRAPVLAVNHDADAILMHEANHPDTLHLQESVLDVDPWTAIPRHLRSSIDTLWASPDCTHFSRARGGKPRKKEIRGLAWAVVEWATALSPRVIALENVPEFLTWGPLGEDGQPDKARAGETFREWAARLALLGYRIEHRVLCAADYGAPTSRRRLFIVGRRDGVLVRWPEPTHGPGRPLPWRTAAECIDWSVPVRSIFDRPKPLAEATQRRIAEGLRRYVIESANPFLLNLSHGGRLEPLDSPLRTITTTKGGERAVVAPFLTKVHSHGWDRNSGPVRPSTAPLWTVVSKDASALVAPTLIQVGYGEAPGQRPRCLDIEAPLGTIVGGGNKHALVAAWLAKHYTGATGSSLHAPVGTVTAKDHHSLVAAFLLKYYGQGSQGQALSKPLDTIVSRARFGLVTVELGGEEYVIVDIGMRMLEPRELARAQGFPDSYILTGTKAAQIARIGNSVPPQLVSAVVGAQLPVRAGVAA